MRILYIFALILISSCTKSKSLTCVDFKIGTFKAESTNYKMPALIIKRFEKTQKETAVGFPTTEATIEWKSECNFELNYLNNSPDVKGEKISVKILKIEGRKAICAGTVGGRSGHILNFELEKQK
ncbi:hypothetical protein BST83_05835 [Polaribacter filamentus]|uniref:Lipoprotein n=2 Tax=Polaribacter filamentus TaxID=53483 RepID=A0A2S7KVS1_9FLAO|nr:hypothetical protein BST83_05835 [Polaribacter filamentus]